MFAELVFASLFAAVGGPGAQAAMPSPEPAVIRYADAEPRTELPELRLAADLGCPRHYDRRRGGGERCRRGYGNSYHEKPRHRYGRYSDDRYHKEGYDRYSDDDRRHKGDDYRARPAPRDTLRDRRGRPYPEADDDDDRDPPAYRRGAYDEPEPRKRHDGRGYYERGYSGEKSRPYHEGSSREYWRRDEQDYYRSSYRESRHKKKATALMTVTTTGERPAGSDAGSTV